MAASTSLSSALVASSRIRIGSVLEQHPRDGDALALAAGEFYAALAYMRCIAFAATDVRELDDEVMGVRQARRRDRLLHRRFGPTIADVVEDRAVEQRGVLRHHADIGAQRILRSPAPHPPRR